jgi:hypothetical protein
LISDKSKKEISGVIEKFSKDRSASPKGIAFSIIKNIFTEAIEYRGIVDGSRGVLTLLAVACLLLVGSAVVALLPVGGRRADVFLIITDSIFIASISLVTIYLSLKWLRLELFRPEDEPIIFDRRNRKIYRIFREVQPGWRGLLAAWPLRTTEYDWDLVDAEHHAAIDANTATISRIHALVFVVRASANDPTTVDGFTIGNSMQMGEVTVPAMYEHIRKFMEEDGSHLPEGETLAQKINSPTLLECLVRTGPYGETLRTWWVHARVLTILGFIFLPITLPVLTLLGIFSWLSYVTSTPIRWSENVIKAVGQPIRRDRLLSKPGKK